MLEIYDIEGDKKIYKNGFANEDSESFESNMLPDRLATDEKKVKEIESRPNKDKIEHLKPILPVKPTADFVHQEESSSFKSATLNTNGVIHQTVIKEENVMGHNQSKQRDMHQNSNTQKTRCVAFILIPNTRKQIRKLQIIPSWETLTRKTKIKLAQLFVIIICCVIVCVAFAALLSRYMMIALVLSISHRTIKTYLPVNRETSQILGRLSRLWFLLKIRIRLSIPKFRYIMVSGELMINVLLRTIGNIRISPVVEKSLE